MDAESISKAQIEVATIDGAPVYHWRSFKSVLSDDVDRALVLHEFQRKHFNLPTAIVDRAMQEKVASEAGGDRASFVRQLRRKDASLEDFRRFTAEEIILQAMLNQNSHSRRERLQSEAVWLASLRNGAQIQRLSARREKDRVVGAHKAPQRM